MSLFSMSRRPKTFPAWLDSYETEEGVALISPNRPYKFEESEYDTFYKVAPADEASGRGIVNLIRDTGGDFGGPLLELGCGSGKMTLGMCRTGAFPHFLITDGSRAFLDLTRDKLVGYDVGIDAVRFATLLDSDIDRLPASSLSAVVMRSTLHHFLNVPGFIAATATALRPGGSLIFQEPCAGGYLLMGVLARLIESKLGDALTAPQREKAKRMSDTMAAYHRTDVDKTEWEDKHLFRPEQIQEWAQSSGLETRYFSNHVFEDFAASPSQPGSMNFHRFMADYMNYCMGFGESDAEAIMSHLSPFTDYLAEACAGTREPALMGVFVLQKRPSPSAR